MSKSSPASSSEKAPRSGPRTKVAKSGPPPFQRFLDAYREDVWRFLVASVGREDAEDCFQETFVSALRAYPKLRPSSNLRAWVLTIAHHKALDSHRARTRRALPIDPGSAADMASEDGRGDSPAGHEDDQSGASLRDQALWNAVHDLPPRQRSAVVLRFTADLRHREIAAAIGCSEEAARRSLHEGLTKLRQEITA
jgi:RNA polymerase sigma factor (sigma-70 family)